MTDPTRPGRQRVLFPLFAALAVTALLGRPAPAIASDGAWTETHLTVVNESAGRQLTCQFLLAHWFEISLGPIAPGDDARQTLKIRAASGDVAILNEVGERMAVERLICGEPGMEPAFWTTPSVDRLRRGDGALTLGCRLDDSGAECRYR